MPILQNITNSLQGNMPYIIGTLLGIVTTIMFFISFMLILIYLPRDLQIKYEISTIDNQCINIPSGNYTY